MVALLKRNHDTLLEKYELFRQRNQSLEKLAVEKETMYNETKIEIDKLSQSVFKLQRSEDELKSEKSLLESKIARFTENEKSKDEQLKTLKTQKEKFEGQNRVLSEQLELIQNSNEEMTVKKSHEMELMSKEISQLSIKERDARQRLQSIENELRDLKDQHRSMTTELDTRTQENDHLISLLEE